MQHKDDLILDRLHDHFFNPANWQVHKYNIDGSPNCLIGGLYNIARELGFITQRTSDITSDMKPVHSVLNRLYYALPVDFVKKTGNHRDHPAMQRVCLEMFNDVYGHTAVMCLIERARYRYSNEGTFNAMKRAAERVKSSIEALVS